MQNKEKSQRGKETEANKNENKAISAIESSKNWFKKEPQSKPGQSKKHHIVSWACLNIRNQKIYIRNTRLWLSLE